jgi:hypothetical protein
MTGHELSEALERLIDASSLATVVHTLAEIAAEKAEHIRCNWQDRLTARQWDRAARVLGGAAVKIDV